jgi:hypothetical protein
MDDEQVSVVGQPEPSPAQITELGENAPKVSEPSLSLASEPAARLDGDVSGSAVKRINYILRHWRGDLSLGVAYWVNNFLAGIALSAVIRQVVRSISFSYAPLIFAIAVTLCWVGPIAISIWQMVGVWRSAGKHKARGGRGFWAGAARFAVVIGFLGLAGNLTRDAVPQLQRLTELWSIPLGDPSVGTHRVQILRNGELSFVGGITLGVTEEIKRALDAGPEIWIIYLDSPGGRVGEAYKLRELIAERGLVTYVRSGCASACTIAFMGGARRYLAPGARLGYHRGSFPGMTDKDLARENDAYRQWLISIGVPKWFADRAYSTPSNSMWWPEPEQLLQAGVITGTDGSPPVKGRASAASNGLQPLLPGTSDATELTATATEENVGKELQQNSLYAAIKRADPETYRKILLAVSDAVRAGRSKGQIAAIPQPFVYEVLRKYSAYASDEAIITLAELTVAEIQAIGQRDMDGCYNFLLRKDALRTIGRWKYLPPDIWEHKFASIPEIIEPKNTGTKRSFKSNVVAKAVAEEISRRYGPNFALALTDPHSAMLSPETVCGAFDALLRETIKRPRPDSIQLLRYVVADHLN